MTYGRNIGLSQSVHNFKLFSILLHVLLNGLNVQKNKHESKSHYHPISSDDNSPAIAQVMKLTRICSTESRLGGRGLHSN